MTELYMENYQVQLNKKLALIGGRPMLNKKKGFVSAIPFGQLESFGREDTASELTDSSISESNDMIDQIERAVVTETKRSMFRALTRLRGATITNFDGMANAQSANVDHYTKKKEWTKTHKLNHLAEQEGDVKKWAFPNQEKKEAQKKAVVKKVTMKKKIQNLKKRVQKLKDAKKVEKKEEGKKVAKKEEKKEAAKK